MSKSSKIGGPVANTSEDAWGVANQYADVAHGWIQWKGTKVCMDVHCKCGETTHVDDDFCYHVRCGRCGRVFMCSGHVEFIELLVEPDNCVVVSE